MRIVSTPMSDAPSPARARSTIRFATSYTASMSLPSTSSCGMPYAAARSSICLIAICFATGVE